VKNIFYFLSNRCSYERSKVLLEKLNDNFDLTILLSGSLTSSGFDDIKKEIYSKYKVRTIDLECSTHTVDGMTEYSVLLASRVYDEIKRKKPELMILWADRFELLPVAMVCNYMQVPIAHIQGGEQTGNVDNYVRRAISSLAQFHFVSHADASANLKKMGLDNIYDTGCPSIDVIDRLKYEKPSHNYVVCIFHPHTEELDKIKYQTEILRDNVVSFCEKNNLSLYWFAPNNDPGFMDVVCNTNLTIIKNLAGDKFLQLLQGAKFIIGNSSAGIRESSFMGIPSVVVGDRQKNRLTASNVIKSDFKLLQESMQKALEMRPRSSKLFGDGRAADRIIMLLKDIIWEKNQEKKN